jgi:hypothetical protein
MRTQRTSLFGVATMVVILLASGALARLADVALASVVQVTSVGGGGLLTPDNLVGADQRHIAFNLLRLLLPGLLVQALVIKLVVASHRGLSIPFVGTVAVLGAFDIASLGVASVIAHAFDESRSLHALTATAPAALYLSLAISVATLVAEAFVLQGLIELPVRRYPRVATAQSS